MAEAAVIAIVSFCAGVVARHSWPLFVAWQDEQLIRKSLTKACFPSSAAAIQAQIDKAIGEPIKPNPHRRIGLAEQRKRAEMDSMKPVTDTEKRVAANTAAMEQK